MPPNHAYALRHNYVYACVCACLSLSVFVYQRVLLNQRFAVVGISYSGSNIFNQRVTLKNLKKSREIVRNRHNSAEINVNQRDLKMKTCCIENCPSRAADGDGISFFEYVLISTDLLGYVNPRMLSHFIKFYCIL